MFSVFKDLIRYNIEFAIGVFLVGLITVFALLSFFSPYPPNEIYVVFPDQPPSLEFWFGTNSRGQDLFWNLSFAFRNTLTFGLIVAVLSRIVSITVGLLAGYMGGWVDRVLMFFADIFVAIPIFPILILFYFVFRGDLTTSRIHTARRLCRHGTRAHHVPGAPALCHANRVFHGDGQYDLVDRL